MLDTIVSYWEASGAKLDPCLYESVGRMRATRDAACSQ